MLVHGTDPMKVDSDGDGTPDKAEIDAGTSPTDPLEGGSEGVPGDGSEATSEGCASGHAGLLAFALGMLVVLRRRVFC